MDSFAGRLAVVTGGGSGIGRQLVVQLAAAGCSVATCDLDGAAVRETAVEAAAGGPDDVRVTTHVCDVGDEASVARFRDEVVERHRTERVDLLFNNAGIGGGGSFLVDDRDAWERTFRVCWGGVYNVSRAFVPSLVASDDAWLVNVSSVNGFWATHQAGSPNTAYATAKFAVKGFSEALIEDFRVNAPQVKVAVVMPGAIGTGFARNSARILRGGAAADERATLLRFGLPVQGADARELRRLSAILDEVVAAFLPTTAAGAAAIVLDGVLAGRWRILVGDDARRYDELVRADPEGVYAPGFSALDLGWFTPVFALRVAFDGRAAADLAATVELRSRDERVAVRVADGRLAVARGAAEAPDAVLDVEPEVFRALVAGEETLDAALGRAAVVLTGDRGKVERLLAAVA